MEEMVKKTIVDSLNQITGSVLNNANFCGSAEEQEHAKEVDGAADLMPAIKLHYLYKPQAFLLTIEHKKVNFKAQINLIVHHDPKYLSYT